MSTNKPISLCQKCRYPDTFEVFNKEEETFRCANCGVVEYAGDIKVLDPKKVLILNIVAFCTLMEGNNGILGKSPDYILNKFNRYLDTNQVNWLWGLDSDNKKKLSTWTKKWLREDLF